MHDISLHCIESYIIHRMLLFYILTHSCILSWLWMLQNMHMYLQKPVIFLSDVNDDNNNNRVGAISLYNLPCKLQLLLSFQTTDIHILAQNRIRIDVPLESWANYTQFQWLSLVSPFSRIWFWNDAHCEGLQIICKHLNGKSHQRRIHLSTTVWCICNLGKSRFYLMENWTRSRSMPLPQIIARTAGND